MTNRRIRPWQAILIVTACVTCLSAQGVGRGFDIASIKQNTSEGPTDRRLQPGTINYINVAVGEYILLAYGISMQQLSGPGWVWLDRYDIAAKTSDLVPVAEVRLRLRALLAERFGLSVQQGTRETPVLALTVGPKGPRFQASKAEGPPDRRLSGEALEFRNTSMEEFVRVLANLPSASRVVVDQTGLKGAYDFRLNLSDLTGESKAAVGESVQISLYAALSALGLRLESRRVPIDFITIARIERQPLPN